MKRIMPMISLLSLLLFPTVVMSDVSTAGAAYMAPSELSNDCTLEFGVISYVGPTASFLTRGYNGLFPSPTIRVKAGQNLTINLINDLADVDNTAAHNDYQTPNTTNLHTHGLHVSSSGVADNVFLEVEPKHSQLYTIPIPDDHMGGTFWYHPHHHGSTALQAGGGAAGVIIVDDGENEVPPEIAEMEEMVMMMLLLDMSTISDIQAEFNSDLWQITGTTSSVVLVNGQTEPVVSMQVNKWYRWRIVYASSDDPTTFSFFEYTGDTSCEMQLLAKDGVYLPTAPREVTELPLYSGTRADVAVRCTGVGTGSFGSSSRRRSRRNLMQRGRTDDDGGGGGTTILTVDVSGDDYGAADLTSFTVNRPCYLADLTSATADQTDTVTLGGGGFVVNGDAFTDSTTYLDTFTTGEIVQLEISGIANHPYHHHVNHFQIVSMSASDSTYFQVGDWHDTIYDDGGSLTARFYTDKFTGKMMIHCHILIHEDQGMMALWNIEGTEGAEYGGARLVDPTCYNETHGSRGGNWPTSPPTPTPTSNQGATPTSVPIPSPTGVPVPSPTGVPIPTPTQVPIPVPSARPIPTPTTAPPTASPIVSYQPSITPLPSAVPIPEPTKVPILAPTLVPIPSPTKAPIPSPTLVPIPSPSKVPIPSPSPQPTILPTPSDQVAVDVSLSLTADNCDDVTEDVIINAFVATVTDISSDDITNFDSQCSSTRRRQLVGEETSPSSPHLNPKLRWLSATYTVTFEIQTSLSTTSYTSASAFESAISTSLSDAISDGDLTSNLNAECSSCSITADSASAALARFYPSSAPTLFPSTTKTKKNKKQKATAASASILIVCAVVGFILIAFGIGCYLRKKYKVDENENDKSNNNGMNPFDGVETEENDKNSSFAYKNPSIAAIPKTKHFEKSYVEMTSPQSNQNNTSSNDRGTRIKNI